MKKVQKVIITLLFLMSVVLVARPHLSSAQTAPGYSLLPATSTLTPSSSQNIALRVNTGTHNATSYEIAIDVTGSAVPTNLAISAVPPSGMITQTATVVNITGGKQIQLIISGSSPTSTHNTNNTWVTIGNITFTTPNSGSMNAQLNNMSALYAGTTGNVLTSYFNETYSIQATASPTPTRTPTPTSPPPTVTPTPTAAPPTPTTSPTNFALTVIFRLQGIVTNVGEIPVTLFLQPTNGAAEISYPLNAQSVVANDGGYQVSYPSVSSGTYRVCLKTTSHLKRCFRKSDNTFESFTVSSNMTINRNDINFDNDSLRPGDVNNDNVIRLIDVTTVRNARGNSFRTLANGSPSDLNRDGYISLDDIALAVMNFSSFEMPGDQ